MKKYVIATLLASAASLAQADSRVVPADGSELSQICAAAVTSRAAALNVAAAAGISPFDLESIRCNGLTLSQFVGKYRQSTEAGTTAYVLRKSDETPLTSLCVAAASSDAEFQTVKDLYFADEQNIESQVTCNGLPLKSFARKYRSAGLAVSRS